MKKNNKQILTAAISVAFLIIATTVLFHLKNRGGKESEIEFQVTNPWRETLEIKKDYVAQIKAIQHIELRSMEKGYLQNIYVDEGQFIKKGQKMFQIMPLLLNAELKKAQAEYQLAKIEYDNTLILQKRNVVSINELRLSKARLDKAHAEMEVAQAHMQFSLVKAPFSGIMDHFYSRLGSLVNEGDMLTTLSDNSKMWVYFNVSEADYLDYMEHKKDSEIPVELRLANGHMFSQKGVVDTIEADFNNEIGNVAFRATFENPEKLLRHGETGTVLLTKKYKDALLIPQKATFEVLDKKFVYVVDEKNEIHPQEIKVAAEVPHFFVIASGLNDDDKILLEGLGKVHAGETIKTLNQTREEVLKSLELSAQ